MNNNDLVAKLWKLCDNLRDGGVSYQNYVNELASLLFLKMCKETGQEADYLPEGYRWDDLKSRIGQDQMQFYRNLLVQLGADEKKLVQAVFHNVSTTIEQPKQLTELVSYMDALDWYNGNHGKSRDDFGDMYEGLLQKNANETKSGAGQYFTPRPLIKPIIHLLKPQPREVVQDPAAGTAGFLIEADRYVKSQTHDLDDLDGDTQESALLRSVKISDGVQSLVAGLDVTPAFVLAKGGITSSDVGTKALRVRRARVLGQLQPGVPVWRTGPESHFPGTPYVIFPGNTGGPDTLRLAVETLLSP